jgi:DNA-binding transcriptional LysR family regulator
MNETDEPIDLILLQTFIEVVRLGSVTAAAKTLSRSQPAISNRLRSLESELGVSLFEKVGRKLELTEFGQKLQSRCADLMALSRSIRDIANLPGGKLTGRIRVGTAPTIAAHLLVSCLSEFLRDHNELELVFRLDLVDPLLEQLRQGIVDVVLVFSDHPPEGFDVTPIGATQLAAILPPAYASHRGTISVRRLRELRYLAWQGPRDPGADLISSYVHEHKLANQFTPRIPHVETLRELVADGAGYTILPRYTAYRSERQGQVVTRLTSGLKKSVNLYMVGRKRQVHAPALDRLRSTFLELGDSPLLQRIEGR